MNPQARDALKFYGTAVLTVIFWSVVLFIVSCCTAGCSPPQPPGPYFGAALANVTSYSIHPTRTTPSGISIDDPLFQVSNFSLDDITDRLERCLSLLPVLSDDQLKSSACISSYVPRSINRGGFVVKIPPDWYHSACHPEQELFPCSVDPSLCDAEHLAAKGQVPDPRRPCACRATVQDNHAIITAPNLLVYAGELLRLVTACNNVWVGPLASCAGTYPRAQVSR